MSSSKWSLVKVIASLLVVVVVAAAVLSTVTRRAAAASPPSLNLNVLLIGDGTSDATTAAWQSALSSEGWPTHWRRPPAPTGQRQ